MKKATRQLLQYLKASNPKSFAVSVKPLPFAAAKENHCFENAMKFLDENESWVLRSGWLVGDYFGEKGTAVMPHYWVFNPKANCDYDVTPLDSAQKFEYSSVTKDKFKWHIKRTYWGKSISTANWNSLQNSVRLS